MRVLKKIMAVLLAVAMMAAVVSCGKKEESKETTQKQETKVTEKETTKKAAETETTKKNDEPVTIEIYARMVSKNGIDPNNLYWFNYAEKRLAEMGYNVEINVTGGVGDEGTQGKALRLSTDTLPDIMWGFPLSGSEVVLYGDSDGMLLDLTPYLNEEDMPNAYACSLSDVGKEGFAASYSPDGKIYGMPYITDRTYGWNAGTSPGYNALYVNTEKLAELGLDIPTSVEELLAALRLSKEKNPDMLPLLAKDGGDFNKLVIAMAGFYGYTYSGANPYGMAVSIQNEEIALPAYTKEFKACLEFLNTLYTEGLVPSEFFTMDSDTFKSLAQAGNYLFYAGDISTATSEPEVFLKHQALGALPLVEGVTPVVSAQVPYVCDEIWASAKTKYPEIVAAIMDLTFEQEAMMLYWYGPVIEDEYDLYEYAWYVDGNDLKHPKIVDGTYATLNDHQYDNIAPCDRIGDCSTYNWYAKNVVAGLDFNVTYNEYTDAITGEKVTVTNKSGYDEKYETSVDAYRRLNPYKAWSSNVTTVCPAILYCSESDGQRVTDLNSVLVAYVQENFAQFVTGGRSLDTYDAFLSELKAQGIEELLEIYREGYAPYMESVFGK